MYDASYNDEETHTFASSSLQFLKWCSWVMAILALIHTPILVVNMYGTNDSKDRSFSATTTTFGNLGSASLAESVTIPGCNANEFQFQHCEIG